MFLFLSFPQVSLSSMRIAQSAWWLILVTIFLPAWTKVVVPCVSSSQYPSRFVKKGIEDKLRQSLSGMKSCVRMKAKGIRSEV